MLQTILANGGSLDLKNVLLLVFVLAVIGAAAWFVSTKPIPSPFSWLIYLVLGIVGVVMVYNFLQGL